MKTPQTSNVNWTSDSWFAKHHAKELTEDFKVWWLGFYGPPKAYEDTHDTQHEYWTRCAFALKGWVAYYSTFSILPMPKVNPRRPDDDDKPDGYLESLNDWYHNNEEAVEWFSENSEAIRSYLSNNQTT